MSVEIPATPELDKVEAERLALIEYARAVNDEEDERE